MDDEFKELLQRRNEALSEGGKKYDAYCKEIGVNASSPLVKEAGRYKAVLCWTGSTEAQRAEARRWLKANGFKEPEGQVYP